ncbi:MAG: hypothetical protein U1E05_11160, partial [Patescibacteria group bacterium]|nr:hypothetical protein [Patescibacteria group bacterium]
PIDFEGGGANLYRYVGNDPVNCADPSGLGYRDDFKEATPALPSDWPVHHRLQQRLKERFRQIGIEVDDLDALRGVDPELHKEVNLRQTEFWQDMKAKYGYRTVSEAMDNTPLDEVLAHVRAMDEQYGKVWLKPRGTLNDVKRIRTLLKYADFSDAAKLARGKTILLRASKIAQTLGIMGGVLGAALLARGIIAPSDAQVAAFNDLLDQYSLSMNYRMTHSGRLSYGRTVHLEEAVTRYLKAINAPDALIAELVRAFLVAESKL